MSRASPSAGTSPPIARVTAPDPPDRRASRGCPKAFLEGPRRQDVLLKVHGEHAEPVFLDREVGGWAEVALEVVEQQGDRRQADRLAEGRSDPGELGPQRVEAYLSGEVPTYSNEASAFDARAGASEWAGIVARSAAPQVYENP